jgi:tRNA threonylcarbamoyladenosine modification (KEOPS) complex  Pcc1 subunit
VVRTPFLETTRVDLDIVVPIPRKIARAVAAGLEPEFEKGMIRAEGEGVHIRIEGLDIPKAKAAINSHLRVLKAAVDSIRVIDIQ